MLITALANVNIYNLPYYKVLYIYLGANTYCRYCRNVHDF